MADALRIAIEPRIVCSHLLQYLTTPLAVQSETNRNCHIPLLVPRDCRVDSQLQRVGPSPGVLSQVLSCHPQCQQNPSISAGLVALNYSYCPLSGEARPAYQALCDCLPKGTDRTYFGASVARLRNKVAFYYDNDQVRQALRDMMREPRKLLAKITLGTNY